MIFTLFYLKSSVQGSTSFTILYWNVLNCCMHEVKSDLSYLSIIRGSKHISTCWEEWVGPHHTFVFRKAFIHLLSVQQGQKKSLTGSQQQIHSAQYSVFNSRHFVFDILCQACIFILCLLELFQHLRRPESMQTLLLLHH